MITSRRPSTPASTNARKFAPPGFADVVGGIARAEVGTAPRWLVQFSIGDRHAVVESALARGGTVVGTRDTDYTYEATLRDAQGAEFRVGQFHMPEPEA